MTVVLLLLGFGLLVVGAEVFIRGASRLARAVGVSPLVIGLTVVAYGTSAPEMAVSVLSAVRGEADLAVGNVVGSNICNVLLILGLSAACAPLLVSRQLLRWDMPFMIAVSGLLILFALNGQLSRLEGLVLAAVCVIYTAHAIRAGRRANVAAVAAMHHADEASLPTPIQARHHTTGSMLLALVGLGLLLLGSHWVVNAAVTIAKAFGVSELVIGLTIVAVGTSLPELATSVVASLRGQRDIAIGNVVGSNIFNVLFVLGPSALLSGDGVSVSSEALRFDLPVMVACLAGCLLVGLTGGIISRKEGWAFLIYYAIYVLFVLAHAKDSPTGDTLRSIGQVALSVLVAASVLGLARWGLQARRRPC